MRTKKRTLLTTKVYGFNPWMDQVTAIHQMMETTGQKSEAPILRDLIDEALAGRRRKGPEGPHEPSPVQGLAETLHTIQTLLLKLVRQGETSLRLQDVSIGLIQETLAEAHDGRKTSWDYLAVPELTQQGNSSSEIERYFDEKTETAQDYAYRLAEEIQRNQKDSDDESKENEVHIEPEKLK
jgi:hypothetical protein